MSVSTNKVNVDITLAANGVIVINGTLYQRGTLKVIREGNNFSCNEIHYPQKPVFPVTIFSSIVVGGTPSATPDAAQASLLNAYMTP